VKRFDTDIRASGPENRAEEHGHSGHRWMMIACCVPMLLIAAIAVAAGASIGFLVVAVMCTVMMAAMMAGMSSGGGKGPRDRS
jgi:hypothetical protein